MFGAELFGKAFVPERFRPKIRNYFSKAAIYTIPYDIFGYLFYLSVVISLVLYIYFWSSFRRLAPLKLGIYTFAFFFIIELIFAVLMMAGIYIYVDVQIFRRTKIIEKILPDFLNVVSENLKTGMTLEQALWGGIKPEFGVLAAEVRITAKRVATGEDVGKALQGFGNKYSSPIVRRAIMLIVEGVRGGGEVADTIDRTVDNLRETAMLKEKLLANAVNFVIFISIIVVVIGPGLFALAYVLLQVLQGFAYQIGQTATVTSFFSFSDIAVGLDDFRLFSMLAIGIIAFFASMIIANISKGEIRAGLKYIPIMVGAALVAYFVFLSIMVTIFGNLFSL